ncbi:substrate-binding domain-containing protein [Streptomyces sp. NPDC087903]|uniref:substrate-binding domain-containing protein n=1 Tax=Streptomyces sp. NPDC087903 TaxID=3365819 RepID=UPI00382FE118
MKRQQANAEVNHVAMGLVLAFAAIAVVNTLARSVSERVREFALLRLAWATRRQVLRMLRTEALSVLPLATALGGGIALAVLTAFSIGMTGSADPLGHTPGPPGRRRGCGPAHPRRHRRTGTRRAQPTPGDRGHRPGVDRPPLRRHHLALADPTRRAALPCVPGRVSAAKARDVAENMIQAHPDLDYAFVANEEMAFAVRKAFDAAGSKAVKIVTVNGTDEGLAALKNGRFSATVSNSAADTGELAVTNAIALLRREEAEKVADTPVRLVTRSNADTAPLYCPPDDY